jgi:hypothetical protein
MFNFFKALRLFGIVSEWSAKALMDGKITSAEAFDLITKLAGILGIPTEIDIPLE